MTHITPANSMANSRATSRYGQGWPRPVGPRASTPPVWVAEAARITRATPTCLDQPWSNPAGRARVGPTEGGVEGQLPLEIPAALRTRGSTPTSRQAA